MNKKTKKVDWIIHLCVNDCVCEECGKKEDQFLPFACNAHTHGMEKYNHMDFQMVLRTSLNEIGRILNTFGLWVQEGKTFHNGDLVSGIYEDCQVRLDEYEETGRTVLRVIIPDKYNLFPEDPKCDPTYKVQTLKTDDLYLRKEVN